MKILLAAVNAKYIHSNLAVYSLKAYAKRYREKIGIVEYTINQTVDEILMDIYKHQPDILCFSCYLWNIVYVEQLLREVPKVLPHTKLWLGGPEVSYNASAMLEEFPALDGIMCGEGEETFCELMDYYHGIKKETEELSLAAVRGIAYRGEDGRIVENPLRPVIGLSTVPFVYEHLEGFRNRIIYYESSRGCPFSCSYCLSSVDKCLRFRDLELVKKELLFFLEHQVPQVKFVDRTFNCRHEHAMEIWSFIKEHDNGITNFHFEVAADLLSDEELALLADMRPGLVQLEIGVQSANTRTLQEIRRKTDLTKVADRAARLKAAGNVHRHLDLIAGLPWEGYESFSRSFNTVYAMEPEQLQLGFLKVLKGSLMHEKAEEYGLVCQERPPYEVLFTRWLSYGDVIRLKKIEEMVEVYYNSGQFRNTMEHLEEEFEDAFSMYEALAEYYEKNDLFERNHSRIARYEILLDFIREKAVKETFTTEGKMLKKYREWLTLDLYLRDNVKNRPAFLGESAVTKEEAAAFYKKEAEDFRYLKGYEGRDSRQLRKMTHLERIGGMLLLFDYTKRSALTQDAAVYQIKEEKFSDGMGGKEE